MRLRAGDARRRTPRLLATADGRVRVGVGGAGFGGAGLGRCLGGGGGSAGGGNQREASPAGNLGRQLRCLKRQLSLPVTLALVGALGLLCALGAAYRLWLARPALPTLTRRHMYGTTLIARTDMPAFTASLVARALNPRDDRRRRRDERALAAIKPSDADVRSILTDAHDQKRELTKAEASADARMNLIGDEAARYGLVRFGSVPMPPDVETLHSLICASTGTGKTVALRQLLGDIRRRGDRAIVIDAGHDLSRSFRRDDDLVLSAGDDGSLGWDLRNEVRKPSEWARFVAAVVPAIGSGESGEWTRKAQSFLTAICEQVGAETTVSVAGRRPCYWARLF